MDAHHQTGAGGERDQHGAFTAWPGECLQTGSGVASGRSRCLCDASWACHLRKVVTCGFLLSARAGILVWEHGVNSVFFLEYSRFCKALVSTEGLTSFLWVRRGHHEAQAARGAEDSCNEPHTFSGEGFFS